MKNLEAAEAQLIEIMESANRTEDVLNVFDQLTRVRGEIEVIPMDEGAGYPAVDGIDGVIIMGSASMVSDGAEWIETTSVWLRALAAAQIPILGVCFGHQLLAHAFGGMVADNPRGLEIGTTEIVMAEVAADDPLLGVLPACFPAHVTHYQSAITLPPGCLSLARSEMEPHHAFRLGEWVWGVQFHPEFDETVIRGYLNERRDELGEARFKRLAKSVAETPHSSRLLRRFVDLIAVRKRNE